MSWLFKRMIPFLSCGALLGVSLSEAHGQARTLPSYSQPAASTRIAGAQANVSQITKAGTQPIHGAGYRAPVGGYYPHAGAGYYPGYGNTYVAPDPAGSYLNGAANVISAQGDYLKSYQESQLTKQEVQQKSMDTRRKQLEEWRYEQELMPTAEELRQKQAKAELDRARGDPPLTEIRSGAALNILLANIQRAHGVGAVGPTLPLDPELVRHINLTDGSSNSGTGLLRDGGKLDWPYPLQLEYFDTQRKLVEQSLSQACTEARSGRVSAKVIKQLENLEEDLRSQLKTHIKDLTPSQGIEARRYINDLHENFRTLTDSNVSKYLGGAWSAKGDNVGEVVSNMTREGLKFAPSAQGDDSYYRALYHSLRAYDSGLGQLASR